MKVPRLKTVLLSFSASLILVFSVYGLFSIGAKGDAVDGARRLLVECPDIDASEFAVELADLRSDIALDNIAEVVDGEGRGVHWRLSANRDWVVFKGTPGESYEILIHADSGKRVTASKTPIPGMLTLAYSGVWVRKGDNGARNDWFQGRIARFAGAMLETQGRDGLDRALATHAKQLEVMGIKQVEAASPHDLERRLVAKEPDFTKLLGQILKAELEARAEIFVTAKRVIGNDFSRRKSVDVAEVRPWDLSEYEGIAASLKGQLYFEKETTVTFNAYALFGGVLCIDNRPVSVIRLSNQVEPEGWRSSVTVTLSPGFHDIELIAQGKRQNFKAGLSWTPPGEGKERRMVASDFSPAQRARIKGLYSDKRSRQYPLVRLTRIGRTGFFERSRYWARLDSLSGDVTWTLDGHKEQGDSINICVPADASVEIGMYGKSISVSLDEDRFRYLGGTVDVLTDLPYFLFNDEQLKCGAVLVSEAEMPLEVDLEVIHTRKKKQVSKLVASGVTLGGREAKNSAPREPSRRRVVDFVLDGHQLKTGDGLNVRAFSLPESLLDEHIRVITPEECTGVRSDDTGRLRDASGTKVLVRLTRPSLGDKRRWGIVKSVITAIRSPKRMLVVAAPEEWGSERFFTALAAQSKVRGCTVHLEPWTAPPPGVPRVLGSIGSVASLLRTGDYDGVLFLPSLSDLAEGGDCRTLARALACLTEMAADELGRQRVWLALPPGWRSDKLHSEPFDKKLRRVVSDYGINAVPLAHWIESKPALSSAYEESGIVQPGPVGLCDEIAAYLFDWIYGDIK